MGHKVYTRSLYMNALATEKVTDKHVTRVAEQKAFSTGKLEPLVDPSGFGVIRLSLPRVEKVETGYKLTVGTPMPIETRVDTTGSMGGNVDVAMKVLPDAFELWAQVLPGYDVQVATGIFGDVCDKFPLCRPQFEMHVEKIVKQLTMMVPERNGGDAAEDPDIGIFGGAYLTRAYINRIGLKSYDFTVTDAPGRGRVDVKVLQRVYGDEVFDKIKENGHEVEKRGGTVSLSDIWEKLLERSHAFVIQIDNADSTTRFWREHAGKNRVIRLCDTKFLPHVQAVIIGLTEGTLSPNDIGGFLKSNNVEQKIIDSIYKEVADIPLAAQMQLKNYEQKPKKGDIFSGKPNIWDDSNIWPTQTAEAESEKSEEPSEEQDEWA